MTGQPLCRILASLLCGAIGFGALWITDSGSDVVYRIGPTGP
jgi:hypothetical protein